MEDIFSLSERDVGILKRMITTVESDPKNTINRPAADPMFQAPEVYVALAPSGGIPAMTSVGGVQTPGVATCAVYRIQPDYLDPNPPPFTPALVVIGDLNQRVYNISTSPVDAGTYVPVARERTGEWIALSVGGGGGGPGGIVGGAVCVRVTSSTIDSSGLYPAQVESFGAGNPAPNWTDYYPCKAQGANGEVLVSGWKYPNCFPYGQVSPSSQTGSLTSGSTTIASLTSTSGLSVGQAVSGTDIPPGSVIVSIVDANTITTNLAATGTITTTITFFTPVYIVIQGAVNVMPTSRLTDPSQATGNVMIYNSGADTFTTGPSCYIYTPNDEPLTIDLIYSNATFVGYQANTPGQKPIFLVNEDQDELWVKITGTSGAGYTWTEQGPNGLGGFTNLSGGRTSSSTGLTLYEVNGSRLVPLNAVVHAFASIDGDCFYFDFSASLTGGGGGFVSGGGAVTVKVISSTATSGLYPGQVEVYSAGNPIPNWSDFAPCLVQGANGEVLIAGWEYANCFPYAQVSPSMATASLTAGSTTVTLSTTGLSVGQAISGTGIPVNTFIASIGSGTITTSQAATATISTTLTFFTPVYIVIQGAVNVMPVTRVTSPSNAPDQATGTMMIYNAGSDTFTTGPSVLIFSANGETLTLNLIYANATFVGYTSNTPGTLPIFLVNEMEDEMWMKVTGVVGDGYTWTEEGPGSTTGDFIDLPGGRTNTSTGLDAYEVNGNLSVSNGTIVHAYRAVDSSCYFFEKPGVSTFSGCGYVIGASGYTMTSTSTTSTNILWDVRSYDTDSYSSSLPATFFSIPFAGYYLVTMSVGLTTGGVTRIRIGTGTASTIYFNPLASSDSANQSGSVTLSTSVVFHAPGPASNYLAMTVQTFGFGGPTLVQAGSNMQISKIG